MKKKTKYSVLHKSTSYRIDKRKTNDSIEEREHIENMLVHRFYFFMAFYSFVVGGAIDLLNKYPLLSVIILIVGFIILWLIKNTIVRCQIKLEIILKCVLAKNHTNNEVEKIIKSIKNGKRFRTEKFSENMIKKIKKSSSQRKNIGFTIPYICLITLFISIVASIWYLFFYKRYIYY